MATYQSVTSGDEIRTRHHLDRARQSLRAAEILQREGLHADAVSRAHMANVHAERALLATEMRIPRDARSVHRMATSHFLGNGRLDADQLPRVEAVAVMAGRADEQPFGEISAEECAAAVGHASGFVQAVDALLTREGYTE